MLLKLVSKQNNYSQQKTITDIDTSKNIRFKTPHGLDILLSEGVFVMGNEAFELINIASNIIQNDPSIQCISEVGVGSGIVILTLSKLFPDLSFYGSDISKRALLLSEQNARLNKIKNVLFYRNKSVEWVNSKIPSKVDLIISNPPYLGDIEYRSPDFEKQYPDYKFQPKQALRSYDSLGFKPYFQIIKQAEQRLVPQILFQCNPRTFGLLFNKLHKQGYIMKSYKSKKGKNEFLVVKLKLKQYI